MNTQKIGYTLLELASNTEVKFAHSLPASFNVPGLGVVDLDKVGQVVPDADNPTHKLVERWTNPPPSDNAIYVSNTAYWDGEKWFIEKVWDLPEISKDELKAALANARYEAETKSIEYRGLSVSTDRDSRSTLLGAYLRAQANSNYSVVWKISPGNFQTLDANTIIAIGDVVTDYVQACFNKEKEEAENIESGNITTIDQIRRLKWPKGIIE